MSTPKIAGLETEYGIIAKGGEDSNPITASSLLINSYASPRLKEVQWDYEEENPLRDARGFERPTLEPPEEEGPGLVSVILENGARYYVDHAHPEYSTPECSNPRDLVVHDKAGERVLAASLTAAASVLPPGERILVYKNNSDRKGNSYGCHENYLMDRRTPFPSIVRYLMPFLVTRQVFCGAGKIGCEGSGGDVAYEISQRADFFEVEVGLETTFKRPIINTRDEPHADPERYRRLHVILGDANMSEVATLLKIGTTSLVLRMIEDDFIGADLSLAEPVSALHAISHDPSCRARVSLAAGPAVTALDLQWEFFDWATKYLADQDVDPVTAQVMARWEWVLDRLGEDPMLLGRQLDWVAKLQIVEAFRERRSLGWDDPKLAMVDLQYHDVRPGRGLYYKLVDEGRMETIVDEAEIIKAVGEPPEDTRAWFRGKVLGKFASRVATASWDAIVFDTGGDALRKVPMLDPLKGTRQGTQSLVSGAQSAEELIDLLGGSTPYNGVDGT